MNSNSQKAWMRGPKREPDKMGQRDNDRHISKTFTPEGLLDRMAMLNQSISEDSRQTGLMDDLAIYAPPRPTPREMFRKALIAAGIAKEEDDEGSI